MKSKWEAIAEESAAKLKAYIHEAEDDLDAANDACMAEAELQNKTAVFRVGFTITLNHKKGEMDTELGWSEKHKLSSKQPIPDPNQVKLPLEVDEDSEKPEVHSGPVRLGKGKN